MNLQQVRREYLKAGLSRKQLDSNPIEQLTGWLDQASGVELVDATAMTLASVDCDGQPSQRVVLLKRLDQRGLVFYTNLKSRKAMDIDSNNKVSIHFGWLPLERQVKIQGVARKMSITENLAYFSSRPKDSQLAAWASHQSQPISSRKMLNLAFEQMKEKFSSGEVPLPDFWGGYLIEPTRFEFWQGGGARLHDSFAYIAETNNGWSIQRLAP
ncbi:MAG: pyridoxamine 5'-phosphate oxidase [Enterobacterales bacterium]|nr:pyridoxamine 5'-phosphate oxidase [Enterobacterales bacterium]